MRCVGEDHTPTAFQVFGPKALACINGVIPVLASRCIPVHMFRAAPGSAAARNRIDDDAGTWQALRDDLHSLALAHADRWPAIAGWRKVLPAAIGSRNADLWQPLLALARWFEKQGVKGLHGEVAGYATGVVAEAAQSSIPDADETLLEVLAAAAGAKGRPTPGEVLQQARERDAVTFRNWHPRGVSERLKSYGLKTAPKM